MNYDYYKTFNVLAQTKNFSTTAKKLNVAQSTVSNRIKELEKYLGYALLARTNKTVELTVAGEEFLPYSKRMIAIEAEAMTNLTNLKYKNRINLGSVHSTYQGYIKNILKNFIRNNSDVTIKVLINHTDQLLEYLVDELIDIGVISCIPNASKYITVSTLYDQVILVANNTSDFKNDIKADELGFIDLIYTDLGDSFDEWLREQTGRNINYQIYIDQINEVFDFLHEGFGYAFILESMAEKYLKMGSLKKVTVHNILPYSMKNYIVVNKYKANSPSIKAFLSALDNNQS